MLKALEILGYGPAAHGFVTLCQSKDNHMWEEGIAIKYPGSSSILTTTKTSHKDRNESPRPFGRTEFDQLLGAYEVASDIPCIVFAAELIAAYPEAKVILVERDVESWFRSFQIAWPTYEQRFIKRIVGWIDPPVQTLLSMNDAITKGFFRSTNKAELLANERQVYRDYYELVRRVTPKEKLLDLKIGHGWEPLCEFLGKKVPECEFPRVNDKAGYEKRRGILVQLLQQRVQTKTWDTLVLLYPMVFSGVLGAIAVLWFCYRS